MTSFHDLAELASQAINDVDNSTFSNAVIIRWLNDAIRDYSQHFPRIKSQSISCAASDHDYDLATDFMAVLSVEYPTGEDPKEYLSRLPQTHTDFWTGEYWYDVVPAADESNPAELIVSADTALGETITVIYNAIHQVTANTDVPTETVTVPTQHQHLMIKYCQWQAAVYLQFAEQQSPTSSSSLLMAQLAQNARRLEASYHTAVKQAIYAADGESRIQTWITTSAYSSDDSLGRVY